jgi:hypothetical protein
MMWVIEDVVLVKIAHITVKLPSLVIVFQNTFKKVPEEVVSRKNFE